MTTVATLTVAVDAEPCLSKIRKMSSIIVDLIDRLDAVAPRDCDGAADCECYSCISCRILEEPDEEPKEPTPAPHCCPYCNHTDPVPFVARRNVECYGSNSFRVFTTCCKKPVVAQIMRITQVTMVKTADFLEDSFGGKAK